MGDMGLSYTCHDTRQALFVTKSVINTKCHLVVVGVRVGVGVRVYSH